MAILGRGRLQNIIQTFPKKFDPGFYKSTRIYFLVHHSCPANCSGNKSGNYNECWIWAKLSRSSQCRELVLGSLCWRPNLYEINYGFSGKSNKIPTKIETHKSADQIYRFLFDIFCVEVGGLKFNFKKTVAQFMEQWCSQNLAL